jgi:hypothetical protein
MEALSCKEELLFTCTVLVKRSATVHNISDKRGVLWRSRTGA